MCGGGVLHGIAFFCHIGGWFIPKRIAGHWMLRILPLWDAPPPKESIRAPFADTASGEPLAVGPLKA